MSLQFTSRRVAIFQNRVGYKNRCVSLKLFQEIKNVLIGFDPSTSAKRSWSPNNWCDHRQIGSIKYEIRGSHFPVNDAFRGVVKILNTNGGTGFFTRHRFQSGKSLFYKNLENHIWQCYHTPCNWWDKSGNR